MRWKYSVFQGTLGELQIFENYLYFSIKESNSVYSCDKYHCANITKALDGLGYIFKLDHPALQPAGSTKCFAFLVNF